MADSTQQVILTAQGLGEEPQLEFSPPVLELGPCLPDSTEAEAEVTVRNPCSFPIEFYCLEVDVQYLEEEKVGLFFVCFWNNVPNLFCTILFLKARNKATIKTLMFDLSSPIDRTLNDCKEIEIERTLEWEGASL